MKGADAFSRHKRIEHLLSVKNSFLKSSFFQGFEFKGPKEEQIIIDKREVVCFYFSDNIPDAYFEINIISDKYFCFIRRAENPNVCPDTMGIGLSWEEAFENFTLDADKKRQFCLDMIDDRICELKKKSNSRKISSDNGSVER
jgi:hypothetical protein